MVVLGAKKPRFAPGTGRKILSWSVAVMALVGDLLIAGRVTGVPGVLAMLAICWVLGRNLLQVQERTRGGLLGFKASEIAVLLALACLIAARSWLLVQQFATGDLEAADLQGAASTYIAVFTVLASFAGLSLALPERFARAALRWAQRPALLLAGSFAGLILLCTLALVLPVSVTDLSQVSFIDALFTITSAVCVTGLTVNDPGTTYTFFGQLVILASIQLGGIGIMTLAALALAFARDTALSTQLRYAAMLDARTLTDLRTIVRSIVLGTFACEAVGAVALFVLLQDHPGLEGRSAAWMAVFHSVSAFCNAGFALFEGNLARFHGDFGLQAVIAGLIVCGGIGFPVLRELTRLAWSRSIRLVLRSRPAPLPMSLGTRVVLRTTLWLVLGGAVSLLLLEWGRSMAELDFPQKLAAALFASVNTRTSGFNTVDIGAMSSAALLVTCVLMFIGGSPGSTAGGIKTTTFAAIMATMRAELSGREPRLGPRALAPEVSRKAIAVVAISGAIVLASLLALTLVEDKPFLPLLFEAVSAFATVGLSTGITADLTPVGKLVVIVTMFIGRVGPFTIALAVASTPEREPYRLAREQLPIG